MMDGQLTSDPLMVDWLDASIAASNERRAKAVVGDRSAVRGRGIGMWSTSSTALLVKPNGL